MAAPVAKAQPPAAAREPLAGDKDGGKDKPQAPVMPPMRKAAIAALLLGDELTKKLFRQFRPDDVRRLLGAANQLKGVTEEECLVVLEDLCRDLDEGVAGVSGHGHRIEEAAVSVFGVDLIRTAGHKEVAGIAMQLHAVALDKPDLLARTLEKEHPQTIAVILSMLPGDVGGKVMKHFPRELKIDVVRRVAKLRTVSSTVLAEITDKVGREFARPSDQGPVVIDGMEAAVKLIKALGAAEEQPILEGLGEIDGDMSQTIKSKLFTFEDIKVLHDREIQSVMREIDQRHLPLALKTASPELQAKLLSNVSKRAAEMLKDDMEAMGPVTLSQVEEAQNKIVEQVLALAAAGRINIRPGDTV